MATRNIVPRATGEGSIGTSAKTWGDGYFDDITVTNDVTASTFTGDLTGNVTGDVTGTASGNLPLTGGTMTGSISIDGVLAVGDNDTNGISVYGGTDYTNGAWLALCGKDNATTPGLWRLQARDGANNVQLLGYPDGRLTWGGNNVLTNATVGAYTSNSPGSAVSLTANTAKNITSMSLDKGTWLVIGKAYFSSNTASRIYGIQVGTSSATFTYNSSGSAAVQTSTTGNLAVQAMDIIVLASTTTVYLCGFSNNSATVTAATLQAVRIV